MSEITNDGLRDSLGGIDWAHDLWSVALPSNVTRTVMAESLTDNFRKVQKLHEHKTLRL